MKNYKFYLIILMLVLMNSVLTSEDIKIRVIVTRANVRLKPDLSSPVIYKASLGTIFHVKKQIGEWINIDLLPDEDGVVTSGYIHESIVEIVTSSEENTENRSTRRTKISIPEKKHPIAPIKSLTKNKKPISVKRKKWGLNIYGGLSYMHHGDLNSCFQDLNCYNNDLSYFVYTSAYETYTFSDGWKSLHFGPNFEFLLTYPISQKYSVGLGVEYISGNKKDNPSWYYENTYPYRVTEWQEFADIKTNIRTIPIKISIFYSLKEQKNYSVNLIGGLGYYFSKLEQNETISHISKYFSSLDTVELNVNGGNIGVHAGFLISYEINRNFSFLLEGLGRYAKIRNLEGNIFSLESDEYQNILGTLKIFGVRVNEMPGEYAFLGMKLPNIGQTTKIENASLDFSGFSLRIGLKMYLF